MRHFRYKSVFWLQDTALRLLLAWHALRGGMGL